MRLQLLKIVKFKGEVQSNELVILAIGMVTAFVVSLFVIKALMSFIKKHGFTCFGWYRIVLGVLVLILGLTGVIGF